jgi:hypothetical protein
VVVVVVVVVMMMMMMTTTTTTMTMTMMMMMMTRMMMMPSTAAKAPVDRGGDRAHAFAHLPGRAHFRARLGHGLRGDGLRQTPRRLLPHHPRHHPPGTVTSSLNNLSS